MAKGPEAFRTISEAAEELGVPQHVLRFWESKFSFIRPMKRAGGRRFYRPQDIREADRALPRLRLQATTRTAAVGWLHNIRHSLHDGGADFGEERDHTTGACLSSSISTSE